MPIYCVKCRMDERMQHEKAFLLYAELYSKILDFIEEHKLCFGHGYIWNGDTIKCLVCENNK